MEEKEMILGCVKQNRKAQEVLYNKLRPRMMGLCMRYSDDKQQAEDYLHNGYIKLFANIYKYKFQGSFEGWARKLFNNSILDDLRLKKRFSSTVDDVTDETFDKAVTMPEDAISQISQSKLVELIQQLSPAYRTTFNLYVMDGYTHEDIAFKLGVTIGTSKSNLYKAKEKLREILLEYGITKSN